MRNIFKPREINWDTKYSMMNKAHRLSLPNVEEVGYLCTQFDLFKET